MIDPKPKTHPLHGVLDLFKYARDNYPPGSRQRMDGLEAVLSGIIDTLANLEYEKLRAAVKSTELDRPVYTFKVDRTHDPLKDGVLRGTMTVDTKTPTPTPAPGPCPCESCKAYREQDAKRKEKLQAIGAGRDKARAYMTLDDLFTLPPFDTKGLAWKLYEDLIAEADKSILKSIMGQGTFSNTYSKTPEEPKRNTYRDGPVKDEARLPSVLAIKEKARVAFSFPVGSINSAMLGDALGDAYVAGRKAGRQETKPESAYSGELRAALQGYGFSGGNGTEWSNLLRDVATMVRNARERRGGTW